MTTSEIAQAIDDLITRQYQLKRDQLERELTSMTESRERLRRAVLKMNTYYAFHMDETAADGTEMCRDWSLLPEDLKGDNE